MRVESWVKKLGVQVEVRIACFAHKSAHNAIGNLTDITNHSYLLLRRDVFLFYCLSAGIARLKIGEEQWQRPRRRLHLEDNIRWNISRDFLT